jgi:fructuronate reductase
MSHPVRLIHLGLGAFHRAHQAWYTQLANSLDEAEPYGIWAFTGRRPDAARVLAAQGCRYTLIERGPEVDRPTDITAIVRADDGADMEAWRAACADPAVAAMTLTITEAGYRVDPADLGRLRADEPAASAPGRIIDGLRLRMRAGAGPLAVVSCDNLSANGSYTANVIAGLARELNGELGEWVESQVSFVSTMVDRITPATTSADVQAVAELAGWPDQSPVVAEPFSEWVISGAFPAGRPAWEQVGVTVVDDVEPYEQRKLWLLNGGHSLLAYLGLSRGHSTIAEAMADPVCLAALEQVWTEAAEVLPFDADEIGQATQALRDRFTNSRIRHQLVQIASDGSQKLPFRIIDVQRARRAAGLPLGVAGLTAVAAWTLHLQGHQVKDAGAGTLPQQLRNARTDRDKVTTVLRAIAPEFEDDSEVLTILSTQLQSLTARS